ncbi:PKD domain-containing protein [Tenggerimyces flavus]|uniref:PKD domain-containing protein n=1 Tax=Tenggerimyces flavus TaxID=1708749 RepID=A0ABV7Y753_9ACTN|nr:PKD domain-containing protein [Tenggerimyces flavus]MBM7785504.1 chitodextrinase [Tenggerimyces flavus]
MRRSMAAALVLGLITLFLGAVGAGTANAAETKTATMTLSGSGEDPLLRTLIHCDGCAPDAIFDCGDDCEITAGIKFGVTTQLEWSAPFTVRTTHDPADIHQGDTTNVSNTVSAGAGTMRVRFAVPWEAGLFACGGSFKPCGPKGTDDWQSTNYRVSGTLTMTSAPVTCTPPITGLGPVACNYSASATVLPETCIDPACLVDIQARLGVTGTVSVDAAGVIVSRTATFHGAKDLTVASSPAADDLAIPCSAAAGTDLVYGVGPATYRSPSVRATGNLGLNIYVDGPGPANLEENIGLASGTIFDQPLSLTGGSRTNHNLGDVQRDAIAPRITGVQQAGTFVEGANVGFSATVTDNCLGNGASYAWAFSDGGSANGNPAQHAFADNGSYTGKLTVSDAGGNPVSHDFAVQPISNAPPSATATPVGTAFWGVPVSFHASAVDPGPADQATLTYAWTFGDGGTAAGADVTHTYANPGAYTAKVTVTDKDGGVGTATVTATIAKRATATTYTGPRKSLPLLRVTLTGRLVDGLGNPVTGRTLRFALGSHTDTGRTNQSGNASGSVVPPILLGTTNVKASFAGDAFYEPSQDGPYPFRVGIL